MKPIAHKLRHRVDIQALVTAVNTTTGSTEEQWVSFLNGLPANITPLSGREFVSAQTLQAGITTRITIRNVAGVLPSMRVNHGGTLYDIKAVLPDPTLARHITMMCEQGVNNG